MIHSSATYVTKDIGSFNFWIGNILDSLARVGVPLFVMISGTIMLDRNYEFNTKKLIKHITKMVIFFVVWSAIYCLIFNILGQFFLKHESINIIKIIGSFIQGHYHLWFVYLIVGLYLIVPLLRLWVKDENKKYVEYFIILSIIFTYILPQIINVGRNYSNLFEHLDNILEKKLYLEYVGGFTTYFILGWYMHNYSIRNKKIMYFLGILGLMVSIIGTYILSTSTGKPIQMYGNLSLNVLFQSIAIFLFIKTKRINVQYRQNKCIKSISENSLGIYAIHALLVTIIYRILDEIDSENAIINIPIVFILSFIIAFFISFILRKVPFLRRIV